MKQNQQTTNNINNTVVVQPNITLGNYVLGIYIPILISLGKSLGKGTFGKVKLATHMLTGEKVAIKILEKDRIKDKKDVERITREIKILKKVRHPNIIQLYEIIETESELYLIMEFCPNGELFDFIVAHQRLQEKLACKMYQELLAGIEYIHESGICHRDLKPENLLLDFDKTLKIVDFGLSNMYEPGENETLKTACGSPCYAAPEVINHALYLQMIAGKRYMGIRTDIWSSGVVLFAMVCGYLPFEDPKTSNLYKKILSADYQIPKFISSDCADLIKKILNTNPDERYTIEQIRNHPWLKLVKDTRKNRGLFPAKEKMPIIDAIYKIMLDDHTFDNDYAIKCIEANRHNQITATYHLIHKKELRHNKQIPENPMRMVASSIDRAQLSSKQSQDKQRQSKQGQRPEISQTQTRRGESNPPVQLQTLAVSMATTNERQHIDLNQTQPANFYPNHQYLQSVHGGEEKLNLNESAEVSAQKKYKLQLQAEISKLKSKYQTIKKEESSDLVKKEGSSRTGSTPNTNNTNANKSNGLPMSSNKGDNNSPSPDHYAFVQNLQEQLSQTSKHTQQSTYSNQMMQLQQTQSNGSGGVNGTGSGMNVGLQGQQQQIAGGSASKNVPKLPSATTTDSTVNTSSYNDYNKQQQHQQNMGQTHHQRFRTQIPTVQNIMQDNATFKGKIPQVNRPKVTALNPAVIGQSMKQAWKVPHPIPPSSGNGMHPSAGGVQIETSGIPHNSFNKTQQIMYSNTQPNANAIGPNGLNINKSSISNALQKFTSETPIKSSNNQSNATGVRTSIHQQPPPSSSHHHHNYNTIDVSSKGGVGSINQHSYNSNVNKKNSHQLNQTVQNISSLDNHHHNKTPQRRGKSTTIDASPDKESMTVARKTITQQLNMSTLSTNNQETDYSYPINQTSQNPTRERNASYNNNIGAHIGMSNNNPNNLSNNANKFTDLRLQTAIDFQQVRAVNNSSQNKNNVYSNALDYMLKQQQTIKNSNQKSTLRYSNHANRNQSISPRNVGANMTDNSFQQSSLNATPNLNITELYKQYSKKHQQQPNYHGFQNQNKQNGRALSVIDPPPLNMSGMGGSVNQQNIPSNSTFSGRHASQINQKKQALMGKNLQEQWPIDQSFHGQMGGVNQQSIVNGGSVQLSSVVASKTLYNRNFHS